MNRELVPDVLAVGQEFRDVAAHPKEKKRFVSVNVYKPSPVASAVTLALRGNQPKPIEARYVRERLQWMKPDGKGGLVPR